MTQQCSGPTIDKNAVIAERWKIRYDGVDVTITDVNPHTRAISFVAAGTTAPVHVATWGDRHAMWSPCPTTLTSGAVALPDDPTRPYDPGSLPFVNDSGLLYLSEAYLQLQKDLQKEMYASDPKWPRALPGLPPIMSVPFELTKLVVTGVELQSGFFFPATFDLTDPHVAQPIQEFSYAEGAMAATLKLFRWAPNGSREPVDLDIRLSSVAVEGVELLTGERFAGSFDLLRRWSTSEGAEHRVADTSQTIAYNDGSKVVNLNLTLETCLALNIPFDAPERLAEANEIMGSARREQPHLAAWARRIIAVSVHVAASVYGRQRITKEQGDLLDALRPHVAAPSDG